LHKQRIELFTKNIFELLHAAQVEALYVYKKCRKEEYKLTMLFDLI